MGFFDALITAGVGLISDIISPPPVAAVTPAVAPVAPTSTLQRSAGAAGVVGPVGVAGVVVPGTLATLGTERAIPGTLSLPREPIASIAAARGITPQADGGPTRFTMVLNISATGLLLISIERGRPLLMSRDIQNLKRINNIIKTQAQKLPKGKVRKQSKASKLTDAIEDEAFRQITQGPACPPPRC